MDLKTAEVPLFQQTCVRFKMRQFHSRLKSVCVPRCVTKVSMHLSISHSLCSAVHNYDSLCRRSSCSPIMLSILLVGRAEASPPSLTTGAPPSIYIYIYIYIYLFIYLFILYGRPFWPPGGPALRANVAGRIGVESDYSCYYAIYIHVLVVRICQTSKVRTKADTAMNSDETSHPRGRSRERRPAESDEQRDARLRRRRERSRERRATESPQHREERLAKRRRRDKATRIARSTNLHQRRQQLCSESTEARESRLQQMRLNQQRRLATETPEETESRLHRARVSQQRVLATETPEETEARLHRARVSQQRVLATETPEETEARLHRARVSQQRVLATETPEETEARLHRVKTFHSRLAALEVSKCITCFAKLDFTDKLRL